MPEDAVVSQIKKAKSKTKTKPKTRKPVAMPVTVAWGAEAIGRCIDRNEEQTRHLIRSGRLRCVKKVGDMWVAAVADLRREFTLTPETAA
jgi:hypothetical protein